MSRFTRFALIVGMAGGMVALPSYAASKKDPDAAGVAEAIRFERAKQAAADRQARIEAGRGRGDQSADRMTSETRAKRKNTKSAAASEKPQPQTRQ